MSPTQFNYNSFISEAWGWPMEISGPWLSLASNVVVGSNPPFSPGDFLSFYPNFGGQALVLTGQITNASPVVTNIGDTAGILPGMAVSPYIPMGNNAFTPGAFPPGTTVLSVDTPNQITLSAAAGTDGSTVAIYNAPFVPLYVLFAYINLASASLVQQRWLDSWRIGMCLYVAHFCTLYLRSNGDVASTPGQLAVAGLEKGITVSKGAGGVSMGIQPVTGGSLSDWGDFQETTYGVQFARTARIVGCGPMWIY